MPMAVGPFMAATVRGVPPSPLAPLLGVPPDAQAPRPTTQQPRANVTSVETMIRRAFMMNVPSIASVLAVILTRAPRGFCKRLVTNVHTSSLSFRAKRTKRRPPVISSAAKRPSVISSEVEKSRLDLSAPVPGGTSGRDDIAPLSFRARQSAPLSFRAELPKAAQSRNLSSLFSRAARASPRSDACAQPIIARSSN